MPERTPAWYEGAREAARRGFAARDPADASGRSGAAFDAARGYFVVPMLGRSYCISHPAGEVTLAGGGGEPGIVDQILLLHYLTLASGLPPRGRWAAFHELPGGTFHYAHFRARALLPLARRFGALPTDLLPAGRALGGRQFPAGHAGVVVPALPRVEVGIVIWRGSEEFDSSASLIFDTAAPTFLSTEDLEHLAFTCAARVIEVADSGEVALARLAIGTAAAVGTAAAATRTGAEGGRRRGGARGARGADGLPA